MEDGSGKDVAIVALGVLLVFTVSASFILLHEKQMTIESLERELAAKERLLEAYAHNETPPPQPHPQPQPSLCLGAARANIVAVRSVDNVGVLGGVHVEVKEGGGRILVNTNPFVEPDTQYSIRTAVEVAARFVGVNLSDKDVVVSFDINGTLIGGPSAGAATTLATIAALEGKKVRSDAVITGTIDEDGNIGAVGAVFEKALAAERNGMRFFLVPEGESVVITYEKKVEERRIFGFVIRRVYYVPKEIDLKQYFGDSMRVVEVGRIEEAYKYMIGDGAAEI